MNTALPLNPESIAMLVHQFYDRVRADAELGPVFDAAIGDNWDPHLARMVDFWCTVMIGSRNFQGNVYGKHMLLNGITPDHFQRWLQMFVATTDELFSQPTPGNSRLSPGASPPACNWASSAKSKSHNTRSIAMKNIPDTAVFYKSTAVFTQDTVPAALQRGHTTAEDVWARIRILEGSLVYRITDPRVLPEEVLLTPELHGVVEPHIQHEVQVVGPVRFQVDFHR